MLWFGIAAVVVVAPRPARGDGAELARAREQLDQVDYDGAAASLAAALHGGGNSPSNLIEIYSLWGTVEAALGHPARARELFSRLLALDPAATLPGKAPRITRELDAARTEMGDSVRLTARYQVNASVPRRVAVTIESDPFAMVTAIRASYRVDRGRELTARVDRAEPTVIPLPDGGRIELAISAVDEWGNQVIVLATADSPVVIEAPVEPALEPARPAPALTASPPPRDDDDPVPLYRRWYLWAGLSAVAAAGGVGFTWRARSNRDRLDELNADSEGRVFSQTAQVEEDRLGRNRLLSILSFAVSGGLAATGVVLGFEF